MKYPSFASLFRAYASDNASRTCELDFAGLRFLAEADASPELGSPMLTARGVFLPFERLRFPDTGFLAELDDLLLFFFGAGCFGYQNEESIEFEVNQESAAHLVWIDVFSVTVNFHQATIL